MQEYSVLYNVRVEQEPEKPARKRANPPAATVDWGRAASEYRPGRFIKEYLDEHGEASMADIYRGLAERIIELNEERAIVEEPPLRRPNYTSFATYFHWFKLLGLVESTGRYEPAFSHKPELIDTYHFLLPKHFYRLTPEGRAEVMAWEDPLGAVHPEHRLRSPG